MSNQISGARYLAESLVSCGIDHVFFIDAILRRTLIELEQLGVKRMLTHSEKAAAYMADGFARVNNGLGADVCEPRVAELLAECLREMGIHQVPIPDCEQPRHAWVARLLACQSCYAVAGEVHEVFVALLQSCDDQLVLGAEVVVERFLGHAGLCQHGVDPGCPEAMLAKEFHRGFDQVVASAAHT